MNKKLWIIGYKLSSPYAWAFQGVCDSEEKAKAACVDEGWFIAPATLNEIITDTNLTEWVGAYYPKASEKSKDSKEG